MFTRHLNLLFLFVSKIHTLAFNCDNSFKFGKSPIPSSPEQTQSDVDTISQCQMA